MKSHISNFLQANMCIATFLKCDKTLIEKLINNFASKQLWGNVFVYEKFLIIVV